MGIKNIVKGPKIYECGICGGYHPWHWAGDCREDRNRFGSPEEYAERTLQNPNDIEVLSMSDRCRADCGDDYPGSDDGLV